MLIYEIGQLFATIMILLIDIVLCEVAFIFGKTIYDDLILDKAIKEKLKDD